VPLESSLPRGDRFAHTARSQSHCELAVCSNASRQHKRITARRAVNHERVRCGDESVSWCSGRHPVSVVYQQSCLRPLSLYQHRCAAAAFARFASRPVRLFTPYSRGSSTLQRIICNIYCVLDHLPSLQQHSEPAKERGKLCDFT